MSRTALLPLLLALLLAGCGSSSVTNVATTPAAEKEAKRATARAQRCLASAHLTTSTGRKALLACLGVNASHEKAALSCIQHKVAADLTHTGRLPADISNCALG